MYNVAYNFENLFSISKTIFYKISSSIFVFVRKYLLSINIIMQYIFPTGQVFYNFQTPHFNNSFFIYLLLITLKFKMFKRQISQKKNTYI